MNLRHPVYNFIVENPDVTLEHGRDSPKVKVFIAIEKKSPLALCFSLENKVDINSYFMISVSVGK
jgi:hypothetical protein